MAAQSKVFHFEEVLKHNATKDCWLIIDGKVWQVKKIVEGSKDQSSAGDAEAVGDGYTEEVDPGKDAENLDQLNKDQLEEEEIPEEDGEESQCDDQDGSNYVEDSEEEYDDEIICEENMPDASQQLHAVALASPSSTENCKVQVNDNPVVSPNHFLVLEEVSDNGMDAELRNGADEGLSLSPTLGLVSGFEDHSHPITEPGALNPIRSSVGLVDLLQSPLPVAVSPTANDVGRPCWKVRFVQKEPCRHSSQVLVKILQLLLHQGAFVAPLACVILENFDPWKSLPLWELWKLNSLVYDVTPFMDDHPGGDEVLLAATGKDATNDFEDVGHSDNARDLMSKYHIGEIDASTVPAKRFYVAPQQPAYNPDKTSEFIVKILQFLVPLAILGLAFAVRRFTKAE